MNWQQVLTLLIIVGVTVGFVWRSSSKKHSHSCNCGCSHDQDAAGPNEKAQS